MEQLSGWLTASEAAERLGVKPATLYAYVSRGVLARRRSPEGQSLFDPAEVERLARRGRPRRAPNASEVVIESGITALGPDRPFYRGRDALELAASASFEAVAEGLWTGDFAAGPQAWRASEAALRAGRAASAALPPNVLLLDRIQAIVPALAATDPLRGNLDPSAVVAVGHTLVAGIVDCLPPRLGDESGAHNESSARGSNLRLAVGSGTGGPGPLGDGPADGSIAARLGWRLGAENRFIDGVRAALVLLADHELAASTLAARVAASVRADPYAVVATGLATVSGALHGGASLGAEALLDAIADPADADAAIGLRLRRGERIPGFGHAVYKSGDGRAGALLNRISALAPDHPVLAKADALLDAARRRRLPEPNIDFALATLTRAAGLPTGAGEAIFAIARIAGWLAHAMEEYERRTPLRLRAVYIGPTG
ncbi:citrate/2-methylcitrate synthase [Asanoa sp. WMMD1127]|uniref:citrate/2-methylcitrate synthase n=1 Tax=Asanoa sp. WMMD1127 TaxID=3016107 RepID=UPI002417AE51|nr:citrate/2-methylcitrate synthase [Asanoa sp. WMMD1127]MDG4821344.1 citrate/2-methylcitrate synthase [Asanoa sp. WMMD1127]